MIILQSIILGIVQGITEFLPVSSTAHLEVIPRILGWGFFPFVFDASIQLGTAFAVLVYFSKDFLRLSQKQLFYIGAATVPVLVIGFLFHKLFETVLSGTAFIVLFMTLGSILMAFAEKHQTQSKTPDFATSMKIGLAQVVALLPGISRSGVTISTGMLSGLSREEAARFSFMLSTPAVLAAGFYELLKSYKDVVSFGVFPWALGLLTSFVVGMLTIHSLLKFLRTKSMYPFVIYRLVLALLLIFFIIHH